MMFWTHNSVYKTTSETFFKISTGDSSASKTRLQKKFPEIAKM